MDNLDASGFIAPYNIRPYGREDWFVREWVKAMRFGAAKMGLRITGASLMPQEPHDDVRKQRRIWLHCVPLSQ